MDDRKLNQLFDETIAIINYHKEKYYTINKEIKIEIDEEERQKRKLESEQIRQNVKVKDLKREEQNIKQKFLKASSKTEVNEEELKMYFSMINDKVEEVEEEKERLKEIEKLIAKSEWRMTKLRSRLRQAEDLSVVIGAMFHYLGSRIKNFQHSEYYLQVEEKAQRAQIIQSQEEERRRMKKEFLKLRDVIMKGNRQECLDCVHKIMFNLQPLEDEQLKLTTAVKQLVESLSKRGQLHVNVSVEGKEILLPKHINRAVFRIIQESLNNVAVHAKVDKATLRMLYSNSALSILISDEGKGFDLDERQLKRTKLLDKIDLHSSEENQEPMNKYYGLLLMNEQAKLIGVELKIISAIGKGTKIHLKVPFKNEDLAKAVEEEKIEKAIKRATKNKKLGEVKNANDNSDRYAE